MTQGTVSVSVALNVLNLEVGSDFQQGTIIVVENSVALFMRS